MAIQQENNGFQIEKPKLKQEVALISTRDDNLSFGSILPTPDLIFKKLGKIQKNVYAQLLTDPYLRGLIQSRKAGTLQLDYEVISNDADDKVVEAVEKLLKRVNLPNLISSILDAPLYGYQPIEVVWDVVDGLTTPVKLTAKPFHWFGYNNDGELVYKEDDYDEEGIKLNPVNFLVPRNEPSYENPYGTPLLSYCYWNVYFKTKGFEFWAEFAEKFGSPNLLIEYGNEADEGKLYDLYQSFVNMIGSGVVTVPEKYKPTLLNGANSSSINIYQSLIENAKKEMEVLLLGHDSSASSEAGKLGNNGQTMDVNQRIINTDKRLVSNTINQLIKYFVAVNFGAVEWYPEFSYKQSEDLRAERVKRDIDLLQLTPDYKFTPQYLSDVYNIDAEYLVQITQSVGGNGTEPVGKPNMNATMSSSIPNRHAPYFQRTVFMAEEFEDQDLADKFVEDVLLKQDNDKMMGKLINVIYAFSTRYDDLNKLKGEYTKIYSKLDTDPFTDVIERATTVSRLLGWHYAGEEQEAIKQDGYLHFIPAMKVSIKLYDIKYAFGLPPEEALAYFKKKGFKVTNNTKDFIKAIQDHAFTVSKVTKMSILSDFKELIVSALEDGLTISEFRKEMKARLGQQGWQNDDVASNHRLNNIYRTNIQESLNIGRTQQMQSVKNFFPFIQNISILDKVTTDECDFLNGKVFSQDDTTFFRDFAPMGHYGCRRRLRAVTQRMFDSMKSSLYKASSSVVQKHKNQTGFLNKNKPYSPNLNDFPSELRKEYKKDK